MTNLINAVKENDIEKVKRYFDYVPTRCDCDDICDCEADYEFAHCHIEDVDNNGKTALIIAAENGHTEIVELLIDADANIDAQSDYGYTALMYAAKSGNLAIVKLLIDSDADIDAKEYDDNYTALDLAKKFGHTEIVELLETI